MPIFEEEKEVKPVEEVPIEEKSTAEQSEIAYEEVAPESNETKSLLEQASELSGSVEIKPYDDSEEPFEANVEKQRKAVYDKFSKNKLVSRIATLIVMVLVIGAILLVTMQSMTAKIIGYVIAGVALVGMLVFFFTSKNKFPNATKAYIRDVSITINQYAYRDEEFKDVYLYPDRKIELSDILSERVYSNIVDIGSRNVIKGKYKFIPFQNCELALYTPGSGRQSKKVAFIGKYLMIPNTLHFEEHYIFVKGKDPEKPVDQPTDIEGMVSLFEEDTFKIYGPEGADYKKVFTSKFITAIKSFNVDADLLNLVVVVWAGHTGIYLSYDDPVTTLPFEHEFHKDAQDAFVKNMKDIFDVCSLINKK